MREGTNSTRECDEGEGIAEWPVYEGAVRRSRRYYVTVRKSQQQSRARSEGQSEDRMRSEKGCGGM